MSFLEPKLIVSNQDDVIDIVKRPRYHWSHSVVSFSQSVRCLILSDCAVSSCSTKSTSSIHFASQNTVAIELFTEFEAALNGEMLMEPFWLTFLANVMQSVLLNYNYMLQKVCHLSYIISKVKKKCPWVWTFLFICFQSIALEPDEVTLVNIPISCGWFPRPLT